MRCSAAVGVDIGQAKLRVEAGHFGQWVLLGAALDQAVREIITTGNQNTMLANDVFQRSCCDHDLVCSIHPNLSESVQIWKLMFRRK